MHGKYYIINVYDISQQIIFISPIRVFSMKFVNETFWDETIGYGFQGVNYPQLRMPKINDNDNCGIYLGLYWGESPQRRLWPKD